jgi:hypothetical protein
MDLFLLEIINGDMAVKNYYIRLFERAYYLTLNWHTQKSQSFTEISQNNTRKMKRNVWEEKVFRS